MSGESRDAREILDRLVAVAELIEQNRATAYLLEHERLVLQSKLRATGWQPPGPTQRELLP